MGGRFAKERFEASCKATHLIEAVALCNGPDACRISIGSEQVSSGCMVTAQVKKPEWAKPEDLSKGVLQGVLGDTSRAIQVGDRVRSRIRGSQVLDGPLQPALADGAPYTSPGWYWKREGLAKRPR
jgi:hypothetical protein